MEETQHMHLHVGCNLSLFRFSMSYDSTLITIKFCFRASMLPRSHICVPYVLNDCATTVVLLNLVFLFPVQHSLLN